MKKLLTLSFFCFLIITCKDASKLEKVQGSLNVEAERWSDQVKNITIYRDDYGVPHIYGKSDADAVFGMVYAQCEDDFNRVELNYIRAIGRLAEVEGEKEIYSDVRANLFMTLAEAKTHYEGAPAWLKKLCLAFADGANYYLDTHPNVKPKLLTHFEPWYPMYFFEGSIGADIEQISTKDVQAYYERISGKLGSFDKPQEDNVEKRKVNMLTQWEEVVNRDDEPRGSNGIALSGKLTTSGNAMLLINPHTSFYFRPELHVVSEEGLNAYGAVTWGQFFVYQGFNEKTGWMHTSSYLDVRDEFIETVSEKEGKYFYKYGNEQRPITMQTATLKYKVGNEIKERDFPLYRTHHGPITHLNGDKWVATAIMWEPVKALTQSFIRTKQSNLAEFHKMMDMRTNSSNNTVYADAEGNIAYYHGNFAPKRDTLFDYAKPVDGSNPATDWQGLHTVDECIVVKNPMNGWIQNCNSTPFTCAGENSPRSQDFPNYMRLPKENYRGVHALRLLKDGKEYTLDKLIETAYDPSLPGFEKLIAGLVSAYDQSKKSKEDKALGAAIETLRKWDYKVSKESVAMSLAHYYGVQYETFGKLAKTVDYEYLGDLTIFDYYGTGSPKEERLSIFKLAVERLTKDFGRWDVPWGEINRFQRLNGDINLAFDDSKPSLPCGLASAKWGALASYGNKQTTDTKRIYGTSGNSFIAVVEFGKKVKAKSLLAGGNSGDPSSPHFYDQAQRYVDAKFKDVAYYKDDVELRAKRKYSPGK